MRFLSLMLVLAMAGSTACKKKSTSAPPPATTEDPSAAPGGDSRNTNYRAGSGVVVNGRSAGMRAASMNDFNTLKQFIEIEFNESGKMPNATKIKTLLNQAQSVMKAINDGVIILTGTTDRTALWAYEVDADNSGGIVLAAGNVRRADATEVKQLLGR